MLFDFMKQIMSRLDRIEEKVDKEQQNLQRFLKKIEKRKVCVTILYFKVLVVFCLYPCPTCQTKLLDSHA